MKIRAIIINGRHGGTILQLDYSPVIRLPIIEPSQISMGEDLDRSVRLGDEISYLECFRSVDRHTVLYSTSGTSRDINYILDKFTSTYPIKLWI